MGHADLQMGLGTGFHAGAAIETEKVRNAKPFDFDVLPNLVVHRAAFQFDGLVALPLQLIEDGAGADSAKGELLKEALVSLK